MTIPTIEKSVFEQGTDPSHPDAIAPSETARSECQVQPSGHQWTSTIPQVASEDIIDIGNGRYAHFRRDRRFAQVQVAFTALPGIDPNPGRELTDHFKNLGWRWREKEPGKPWIYQLDKASKDDPTARGDSRDALHEQFLLIIQEYRQKYRMLPTSRLPHLANGHAGTTVDNSRTPPSSSVSEPVTRICEKQKLPSPAGETRGGEGAAEMLDAFASVGADRFDLTFTDAAGEKVSFRGNRTLEQLRQAISAILQEAAERQHNVIVRPRSSGATLIQLDDLGEDMASRLRPVSFLILRTSPGNSQAWVAVADGDADFARRLRKGVGADLTASGATRVSGSMNFKEKYMPFFPRIDTIHASPGLVTTQAELEALGIVAPSDRAARATVRTSLRKPGARAWPNYQRCVENAPPTRSGEGHDISRADFTFCLLALDWGWSVDETAACLTRESAKAQENGEDYALRTVKAAVAAIKRRGEQQR